MNRAQHDALTAALGRLSPPQHLCAIYESAAEREAVAISFLRLGLERGERAVYIADTGGEDAARAAMAAHGIDVETALERHALLLTNRDRAYLVSGRFEPEAMWAFWRQAACEAREQGFSGVRCIAETDWVARGAPGIARWMEYESRLSEMIAGCGCSILCQYDRRLFPAWMVRDVICTHPLVVARGVACRNMYYEPPAEFLGPDRREREVERLLEQIAQREAVEEKLRRANATNAEILERITDAFTTFDRDWRFVYVNQRAVQLLGKPREALIGRVVWEMFPEGVGMDHYHQFQKAMHDRVPMVFDGFSPGTNRWYRNHVYPTADGVACYWNDITVVRRAQEELRRSEAYLAEGQKISHTGSWAWNVASGEMYWSREHFRICGLEPGEFTPSIAAAARIIHPEDLPAAQQAFDQAVRERRDYVGEFRVLRPDLSTRHVCSVGHPVLDRAGGLVEYVGTIMDITERKQAEEALVAARADLAHVNRTLTMGELAASIAHELNQPLAAIVTSANAGEHWLGGGAPNIGEANDSLRRINRDAVRASEVIARIRALLTRRPSRKVEMCIVDVIRDVVQLVQREAQAQGVQLQVTPAEEPLPPVVGDRVQLQQVVLNMVMNALEAMSEIETARRLELRAERYGIDQVMVSVADTGAGVEPEVADRMFDAFFTTKVDGMGMGLAISRSIVEAHGGRLWVSGNDGPGATLRFTLPSS